MTISSAMMIHGHFGVPVAGASGGFLGACLSLATDGSAVGRPCGLVALITVAILGVRPTGVPHRPHRFASCGSPASQLVHFVMDLSR